MVHFDCYSDTFLYVFLIIDTLKRKLFYFIWWMWLKWAGFYIISQIFLLTDIIIALLIAGRAVAVVNCGKYTDVCEALSIHQFPTIKHRLGITWTVLTIVQTDENNFFRSQLSKDTDWITYEGVVSEWYSIDQSC